MARTTWKAHERVVVRLLGGARHPANTGGRVDVTSARFVAQCKNTLTFARRPRHSP